METSALRLLVLVPHRDARLPLRAWSGSLFAAGLPGAWSFPWVVPLAAVNRLLSSGELKSLARTLREQMNLQGNKIVAGGAGVCGGVCGGEKISIFGPALPVELHKTDDFFGIVSDAVTYRFSPLVLGSAVVYGALPDALPPPPQISFRAAALANMEYSPLPVNDSYSFEWKIGPLHWLPKKTTSFSSAGPLNTPS